MNDALEDYLSDLMDDAPARSLAAPETTQEDHAPTAPAPAPARPARAASAEQRDEPPFREHPLLPGFPAQPVARPDERRRRAEDRTTTWLRFEVSGQLYAVEVLKVQEVLRVPDILPLRGTDPFVLGMMNLRGHIVPVMDLAIRLGLTPFERDDAARVVVLEQGGEAMGLLVDAVADVSAICDGAIEQLRGPLASTAAAVIRGIARRTGRTLTLLDANKLIQ